MDVNKKRNTLPIKTKVKILKEIQNGIKRSEIAKKYNIGLSTLSKIVKNSKDIENNYLKVRNVNKKRDRKPKYENLNKAMSLWFEQMIQKGTVVTGPILMEKAEQFAIQLDIPNFKANVGWLQRWKKSQNIYFKKLHGESASADTDSAESFKRNVLPALLEKYALNEIYNADETGLFYKALPDGTYGYGRSQQSGPKSPKDRITLLFITNATGTDKYVYSIGKYKQPRCFRGKKVPIPYKYNKKAWMTSTIWNEIIRELDEKFKKRGQKILLLIDNASCHKLDFSPESIKIIFLPPCTTSIIQPLDQGKFSEMYF